MNEAKTISRLFKTIKDIVYGGTPFDNDAELKDALKEPLDKLIKFVDEWEKGNKLSVHVYNSDAAKIGTCKQIKQLGTCLAERLDKLEKKVKELEEKSNESWFIREYKRYLNEKPWRPERYDYQPYYTTSPTCDMQMGGIMGVPTRSVEKDLRRNEPDSEPTEEVVRDAFGDGYVNEVPKDAKADTKK